MRDVGAVLGAIFFLTFAWVGYQAAGLMWPVVFFSVFGIVILVLVIVERMGLKAPRREGRSGPSSIPVKIRLAAVAFALACLWIARIAYYDFSAELIAKILGCIGVITLIAMIPTLFGRKAPWES
jgi:hypothetical protein